jgi:hypothetical protein
MKKYTLLLAILLSIPAAVWLYTQTLPPTPTLSPSLTEESGQNCLRVLSPAAKSVILFPLSIEVTLEYGCWTIFEGQAGTVVLRQNGVILSQIDANNGIVQVQWSYYEESDYPVTARATITQITGQETGPAELVLTPENPCGVSPDCPPTLDPLVIPVVLE